MAEKSFADTHAGVQQLVGFFVQVSYFAFLCLPPHGLDTVQVHTYHFPYSFLFNATFNASRRLSECQDAMVVTGYVVDVEETYESALSEDGEAEQMLINAKILMSNIKYLGRERNLQLTMTND